MESLGNPLLEERNMIRTYAGSHGVGSRRAIARPNSRSASTPRPDADFSRADIIKEGISSLSATLSSESLSRENNLC